MIYWWSWNKNTNDCKFLISYKNKNEQKRKINMKIIQQYIKNNKQLVAIFAIAIVFLFTHNYAYCHPMLLMIVGPAWNYFSGISPEFYANKMIDKIFEFSPYIINKTVEYSPYIVYGAGGLVLGSFGLVGSVKVAEFGYNWRYFANQYAQNTPVVGSILKGTNTAYKWCTKKELTNIEYYYFYPKIAAALGYPEIFTSKMEFDFNTCSLNITKRDQQNEFIASQPEPLIAHVPIETTKVITERVVVEKHNEDVLQLTSNIDNLGKTIQQESLKQAHLKSDSELLSELQQISLLEEIPTYTRAQLRPEFKKFKVPNATEDESGSPSNLPISYIEFNRVKDVKIKYRTNTETYVFMDRENFASKYPTIFNMGLSLANTQYNEARNNSPTNSSLFVYFCPDYDITKTLWGLGTKYEYNAANSCFCLYKNPFDLRNNTAFPLLDREDVEYNALEIMREHQLNSLTLIHEDISILTQEMRNTYANSLQRNNPQDSTIEETEPNSVKSPEVFIDPTPAITQTVGAATAVGLVTLLTTSDVFLVLSYLLTNNPLVPLIHNPSVGHALVELYITNNIEIPSYLQNVQITTEVANSDTITSDLDALSNYSQNNTTPKGFHFSWGNLAVYTFVIGAAVGGYYLWKNTGDASSLKEATSSVHSFEEEILKGLK